MGILLVPGHSEHTQNMWDGCMSYLYRCLIVLMDPCAIMTQVSTDLHTVRRIIWRKCSAASCIVHEWPLSDVHVCRSGAVWVLPSIPAFVRLVTFTERDTRRLMDDEVAKECSQQITLYYGNTHEPHAGPGRPSFWCSSKSPALPLTWNSANALLSVVIFPP